LVVKLIEEPAIRALVLANKQIHIIRRQERGKRRAPVPMAYSPRRMLERVDDVQTGILLFGYSAISRSYLGQW
jgi:hypothetical protein